MHFSNVLFQLPIVLFLQPHGMDQSSFVPRALMKCKGCMATTIAYGSQFQLPPQVSSAHDESSPFLIKLLNNRIKKCRGYNREFSRKVDGSPSDPPPPLNFIICHEERKPYRDASNPTRLSRPQNVYYHANLSCIRSNYPSFADHEVIIIILFQSYNNNYYHSDIDHVHIQYRSHAT